MTRHSGSVSICGINEPWALQLFVDLRYILEKLANTWSDVGVQEARCEKVYGVSVCVCPGRRRALLLETQSVSSGDGQTRGGVSGSDASFGPSVFH